MIVFAAIVPHPLESIPGIGRSEDMKKIQKTLASFDELRKELEQANIETIVIISPHAQLEPYSFAINSASSLVGNFAQFGLDETYEYANDITIADSLAYTCSITVNDMSAHLHQNFLDHGTLVPLYHLAKNVKPKVVHLSFSLMNYDFHFRYGEIIRGVLAGSKKRIAVIASGDLSHKLSQDSPAGFSSSAQEFDRMLLYFLGENDVAGIMNLDPVLIKGAAECGLRSIIILLGILHGSPYNFKLLSYESPFGIGYMTARLL